MSIQRADEETIKARVRELNLQGLNKRIAELEAERNEFRYASLERGVLVAKLEQQRDEARELVKQVADVFVAECLIGVAKTAKMCRDAVARWGGEG